MPRNPEANATQEERLLGKAAENRAWATLSRKPCVVDGCDGSCHGWLSMAELAQLGGMSPYGRISTLRTKKGWIIDCIPDGERESIHHFVKQMPVQRDLETGEELRYIGELPVGVGGQPIEFFEVGR